MKILRIFLVLMLVLALCGCGESGTAVYVQSVAELANLGGIAPDVEHGSQLRDGEDEGKVVGNTICVHGMYLQFRKRCG